MHQRVHASLYKLHAPDGLGLAHEGVDDGGALLAVLLLVDRREQLVALAPAAEQRAMSAKARFLLSTCNRLVPLRETFSSLGIMRGSFTNGTSLRICQQVIPSSATRDRVSSVVSLMRTADAARGGVGLTTRGGCLQPARHARQPSEAKREQVQRGIPARADEGAAGIADSR